MYLHDKVAKVAKGSTSYFKHASYLMDKKGKIYFLSSNDKYNHAEINVLRKFNKHMNNRGYTNRQIKRKLKKLIFVNIRMLKKSVGCSKPCLHCLQALKKHGMKKIIYITSDHTCKKEKIKNIKTSHITSYDRFVLGIKKCEIMV